MNEEVKGRCSWCNGVIMERSSHIISLVTPKTLYCGKSCADAADGYKQQVGWIRVDERLPEVPYKAGANISSSDNVSCLVAILVQGKHYKIVVAKYYDGSQKWYIQKSDGYPGEDVTRKVTHWQPLPEPPPIEQKQEAGHCGACRRWGRGSGRGWGKGWGECKVLTHGFQMSDQIYLDNGNNPLGGIYKTKETFGCVEFASKDDDA